MLKHLKPLLKDTVIYALGNISGKVAGFILLPFYVEKLTAAEYGMLGTMEATFQLIVALAGLNLYVAFTRWYWDKEINGRQKSTYFTTLVSVVVLALTVFAGVYPLAGTVSSLLLDTAGYTRLIRLVAASAGLEIISLVPATLCKMQRKPAMYTRNIIIRLAVVLVLSLLFVVVFDRKVDGIYEAQIAGTAVYLLLYLPYTLKNIVWKFEKFILLKMLKFGFPLILSSSFSVVLGIADRYSLNFISGLESVGVYSLGYKLANTLKIFIVMSVQLALTPVVFQMADQPGIKRFMSKIMTYFTFGLMFFTIGISLFGQEIVKVLSIGKPDYWDAYLVVPFIAFGTVFGMLKDTAAYGLQIVKRTGVIASVIVFVSLLNVALNMLLIPFMDALGAGLSTLLSQMIYFGATIYYAQRYYPVAYEFRKIFLSIGLGALFCLAAYFVRDWGLAWRLCIKTLLLLTYPVALYFFRFYDRNELLALQGFRDKWRHPGVWKENLQKLKF